MRYKETWRHGEIQKERKRDRERKREREKYSRGRDTNRKGGRE